ncbi:MAG: hypothetical protein AAFR27_08285 [Pseudomonadota bacterium]
MMEIPVTLTFQTADKQMADEMRQQVANLEISASDNFIGGTEIAAFFATGKEAIKTVLGPLLAFLETRQNRIARVQLVVGKDKIEFSGLSAKEIHDLLESDGLQKAIDSYKP